MATRSTGEAIHSLPGIDARRNGAMVLMGWTLLDGRVNSKDTCLRGEGFLLKMIQLASASLTKFKNEPCTWVFRR